MVFFFIINLGKKSFHILSYFLVDYMTDVCFKMNSYTFMKMKFSEQVVSKLLNK